MLDYSVAAIAAIAVGLIAIIAAIAFRQLRLIEQLKYTLVRSPRLLVQLVGDDRATERAVLEPYVAANLTINCTFDLWLNNVGDRTDRDMIIRLWVPSTYRIVEHLGGTELQKDGSTSDSALVAYRIPFSSAVRPGLPELVGRYHFNDMPGLDPLRLEWDVISDFGKHPPASRGSLHVEFAPPHT